MPEIGKIIILGISSLFGGVILYRLLGVIVVDWKKSIDNNFKELFEHRNKQALCLRDIKNDIKNIKEKCVTHEKES